MERFKLYLSFFIFIFYFSLSKNLGIVHVADVFKAASTSLHASSMVLATAT